MTRFEKRRLKNREALIESAIELFQKKGPKDTTVEEICDRADVARRTFFNHFATREQLYAAIAEQRAVPVRKAFEAAARGEGSLEERLTGLFGQIGSYLGERPAYRELMALMPTGDGDLPARSRPHAQSARLFIDHGIEHGDVTRRHAPEVLTDLLMGALSSAVSNWCSDESYDVELELVASARALLDVLSARTDDGAP